jgi:hypothetical protein
MGMVWIGYEQTEQLREYGVKMRVPVRHIVSEAIDQWLKYVAPARLKLHGLESLAFTAQESTRARINHAQGGMGVAGILEAVEAQIRILQGVQDQLQGGPSIAARTHKLSPKAGKKGLRAGTAQTPSIKKIPQTKGNRGEK